jgi:hypothetical protein
MFLVPQLVTKRGRTITRGAIKIRININRMINGTPYLNMAKILPLVGGRLIALAWKPSCGYNP